MTIMTITKNTIKTSVYVTAMGLGTLHSFAENTMLSETTYKNVNQTFLNTHIIPSYNIFQHHMTQWHKSVETLCKFPNTSNLSATKNSFKNVAIGWPAVASITFGSMTYFDANRKLDFWPDKKSFIARGLKKALKKQDPALIKKIAKGHSTPIYHAFNSSERLLFKHGDIVLKNPYACSMLQKQAQFAYERSIAVAKDWKSPTGFQETFLLTHGTDSDLHASSTSSAFKSAVLGLQIIADLAIGHPLSIKKKKGRPFFAQFPHSRQSKTAIISYFNSSKNAVLLGFKDIIIKRRGKTRYEKLSTLYAKGEATLNTLSSDIYTLASSPEGRTELADAQTTIKAIHQMTVRELSLALSMPLGFNALDGD